MSNNKLNLLLVAAVGILLGAALVLVVGKMRSDEGQVGAPSGPEIENYVPIIMQDGGYFSRKGIYTTSTLQADDAVTLGGATTTIGSQGLPVYEVVGGVDRVFVQITMAATSSVPCSIPNPYGTATTSIDGWMDQITVGMTGTNSYDVSTSTATGAGSSSPALIYARSLGSAAQDTAFWKPYSPVASSTLSIAGKVLVNDRADGVSNMILGPSERLTMRFATSTPGNGSVTGTCSAQFSKP